MYQHFVRSESGLSGHSGTTGARRFLLACFLLTASSHGVSAAVTCSVDSNTCASAPRQLPALRTAPPHAETATAARQQGLPELRFEQASLDFATVDTGSSGTLLTAVLVNESDSVTAAELHFEADPTFPLMHQFGSCEGLDLQPGASCSVRIKFAPTAPGAAFGTLTATSSQGAEAELSLSGTGGDDYVLYSQPHDWETMPIFWSLLATTYSNTPVYSSDMADDFVVENPSGWNIHKVGLEGMSIRAAPATPVDALFRVNDNGLPGTEVLCTTSAYTTVRWEPPFDESRVEIALTPPCHLPPGHYWLQVRFHAENNAGFLGWGLQYVQEPEEPPPVHLKPPVWRQPGGGSGYPGCFDWTALAPPNCGLEDYHPLQTAYGAVFWLIGQAPGDSIFAAGFDR